INVVMVHGGGPEITDMFDKLNIETQFINGLRYTNEEAVEVVQMVLAGKTNKDLVNKITSIGGSAVGLSGIDGGMIKAKKLEDGKNDYGCVGEITEVDTKIITDNIAAGFIPVIATVATGVDGESSVYNINSDTAAAKIAIALGAEKLILLTNTRGLMRDLKDDDTLIPVVKLGEIPALKDEGVISGGMIPKIECCEMCVKNGVKRAHIIDGRLLHSILIEMLSNEGIGTMIIE
ncbi:MAG: acetylglutamate kinase, partial [Eubacteriales bacterium]